MDFSPDGDTLVCCSADKTVRLWDVETRKELKTFNGHTAYVVSANFSPDGKLIVSGSHDSTVRLWNVVEKNCQDTIRGHDSMVWSAVFDPLGQTVFTGSADGKIKRWELSMREPPLTLKETLVGALHRSLFNPKLDSWQSAMALVYRCGPRERCSDCVARRSPKSHLRSGVFVGRRNPGVYSGGWDNSVGRELEATHSRFEWLGARGVFSNWRCSCDRRAGWINKHSSVGRSRGQTSEDATGNWQEESEQSGLLVRWKCIGQRAVKRCRSDGLFCGMCVAVKKWRRLKVTREPLIPSRSRQMARSHPRRDTKAGS